MAWIESHQKLRAHPKTLRLMARLGLTKAQAVGHLHLLWWWCLDYAPEGDLEGLTASEIAIGAEWSGDPEAFMRGMTEVRFIDESPLRIHDWKDFCGALMDRRLKRLSAKRPPMEAVRPPMGAYPTQPNPTQPTQPTNISLSHAEPGTEALELAERLLKLIRQNNPTAKGPPDITAWAKEAERMMRLDKRTKDQIVKVMDFSQADPFWKCNILSMATLRKQFDRLTMKINSSPSRIVGGAAPVPGKYDHL